MTPALDLLGSLSLSPKKILSAEWPHGPEGRHSSEAET